MNRVVPGGGGRGRDARAPRARDARAARARRRLGKRAFYRQIDLDLEAAYADASEVMAASSQTDDAREGMARVPREAAAPRYPDR